MTIRKIALFFCGLMSCPIVLADVSHLIADDAPPGSHIRRDAATWSISFDKKYEDLNQSELDVFRGMYEDLPEGDEPPYPIAGMKGIVRDIVKVQHAVLAQG